MIEALLIFGLATWRIAHLLAAENGPFDVFLKIRKFFEIVHDEDDNVVIRPKNFFAQVISCVWCNSIYIGTFWTVLFCFLGDFTLFLALPFALSAVAIMVEKNSI